MIYYKPRNISFRVLPSVNSLVPKKKKKLNKVSHDLNNEPIIDISTMPVIDGVPMLKFHDDPDPNIIITEKRTFVPEVRNGDFNIIDVSELPDIDGVPILTLPEKKVEAEKKDGVVSEEINNKEIEHVEVNAPEATALKAPPITEKQKKSKVQKAKNESPKKEKTKKERIKKQRSPGYKTHLFKAASFFIMLYTGAVVAFIIPLRPDYSPSEKRNLEKFPEFSAELLLSGEYFSKIDTWFSDTFPYREFLTKAGTQIKELYGYNSVNIHGDVESGDDIPDAPLETSPTTEPTASNTDVTKAPVTQTEPKTTIPKDEKTDIKTQSLGAIIVAGDAGYEYYAFSKDLAPRFINSVSNIKSSVNGDADVYAMIVPTSIDITLNDNLREQTSSADQKKALNYFNTSFRDVTAVDGIYDTERLHRKEYTYFRTDHHWTALGAYYAYEQFALKKGITPIPLENYETKTYDNFLGTFYSSSGQTSKMAENPDYVTAYLPYNNVNCHIVEADGDAFDWNVVTDVTNYDRGSKYLTFIGGDNAITTITNQDNPDGEVCIVIKESYGNAFVPFLIPHYSTIYVIDPRHYDGTLSEFSSDKNIDDVIFIANISTTRNYIYIDAMERLIK